MKTKYILWLFVAVIVYQLAIPVSTIVREENNLKNGIMLRFRVLPVDPNDPFRGKYLNLRFDNNKTFDSIPDLDHNVYLTFKPDSAGLSVIDTVFNTAPDGNYLRTTLEYITDNDSVTKVSFRYPFTRYYVNEHLVADYEKLINDALQDTASTVTASVKLGKGNATLEELFINETPLPQYAATMKSKADKAD